MPSSQRQSQWLHLLDLAIVAIDTLEGKYAWSLGGGTALALRIDHRVSFDIDLFFPDATALRPGDCDADGDIDLADFLIFQSCFTGSDAGPIGPNCACADGDGDDDVDLADLLFFQAQF